MKRTIAFLSLILSISALNRAPAGPWDNYNLAPKSRTVKAVSIKGFTGVIEGAENLLTSNSAEAILHPSSTLTLDFGKEVGGQISFRFGQVSGNLSLAYTESPAFIGPKSDGSSGGEFEDGAFEVDPVPRLLYTTPLDNQRGGFRYLTIVAGRNDVRISNLSLYHTWMPHWKDLDAYTGYFYSSDNLLNRVWYAGAYTVQLCNVDRLHGRAFPFPKQVGWMNDGILGEDSPVLVDAPKRDRTAWVGDLGISLHTSFVSTDILAARNALNAVLNRQNKNGMYNYCGPPWNIGPISDTYHAWVLVGAGSYFELSNDLPWVKKYWKNLKIGMQFLFDGVDETGLFFVTHDADWLRPGTHGRHLGANCLFFRSLHLMSKMAIAMGDDNLANDCLVRGQIVKSAINRLLWSSEDGMFTDNDNTTITPQDGNSLAILYGVATSAQAHSISNGLRARWNQFGAKSSEWPGRISPFISGFEVMAHLSAGNTQNGLDLIRLHWGYLLNANFSTESTFVEGLLEDGSPAYMNPPFLSQSHGWSTGPTAALTYYVVGLQVVEKAGKIWNFAPSVGDLKTAQGGFSTALGFYSASWKWSTGNQFGGVLSTPVNTTGTVSLPGVFTSVTLNQKNARFIIENRRTVIVGVNGGKYTIAAQ